MVQPLQKTVWQLSIKQNMLYSHKGVENLCPLKNLYVDIHRSFTYSCQNLKATFSRLVFNSRLRRTPEGNGYRHQYSWKENSMDRGPWQATVHGSWRVRHDWVTITFKGELRLYMIGSSMFPSILLWTLNSSKKIVFMLKIILRWQNTYRPLLVCSVSNLHKNIFLCDFLGIVLCISFQRMPLDFKWDPGFLVAEESMVNCLFFFLLSWS